MRNHLYTLALHCLTREGGDGCVSIKLPSSPMESCEKMAKEICALAKELHPQIKDWDVAHYNKDGKEFWAVHYEQADIGISNSEFVYEKMGSMDIEIWEAFLDMK